MNKSQKSNAKNPWPHLAITLEEWMNLQEKEHPGSKKRAEAEAQKLRALYAIRAARIHKKVSQKQLAELSGISQDAISKIENGKRNATVETLITLAQAMGKELEIRFV